MKTIDEIGAQGDVMFVRVDDLPDNVPLRLLPGAGRVVVAHSETGHHHVAVAEDVQLYGTDDPMVTYLVTDNDVDVVHERPFDTHEPLRLVVGGKKGRTPAKKSKKKSVWQVRRQRESSPEGSRRVAD